MKTKKDSNGTIDERETPPSRENMMKCEDIQSVLFAYMSRELGTARSDLVREHLRKCPACRELAADIQSTLDLMHQAQSEESGVVVTLSDERRKSMRRAAIHPLLHWIDHHHILVSIVVSVIVIIVVAMTLYRMKVRRDPIDEGPTFIYKGPDVGWVRSGIETNQQDRHDEHSEN